MGVLAVIMARAGSVGLPGKAMRQLLGRPVIAYTFDHAREARWVERTVVSSDDPAVLAFARREGFETIERPAELATAASATDPVLRHAVRTLYPSMENQNAATLAGSTPYPNAIENRKSKIENPPFPPNAVVMLYGNVPLRRGQMIDRAITLLTNENADSVQTIAPVGKMHPYWMFDMDGTGRIAKHVPNNVFRRQDLPALYSPTGAVYVMRTGVLMAAEGSADPHGFLGKDRRGLVTEVEDSVDIDTEKDLWVAEAMLRAHGEASHG